MFNPYKEITGNSKQILIARVKKVILGPMITDSQQDTDYTCEKDLGAIKYELLFHGKMNIHSLGKVSKTAYPIFPFIRQYPVIGEIVMLISGPSADMNDSAQNQDLYYFPPYSLFNSPHLNAFPNMNEYISYVASQLGEAQSPSPDPSDFSLPVGINFTEKTNVKSLRPFEGDTVFQGRWGQSIRFGSTTPLMRSISPWSIGKVNDNKESGDPITILINSQRDYVTAAEKDSPTTVEDINKDGSSIYMTSTQAIMLKDINNFEIRSWKLGTAVDPLLNTVIVPEQIPTSNEFLSPSSQDSKTLNGNFYVYGPNGEILEERDAQGNLIQKF